MMITKPPVLGSLLFSILVSDICKVINYSRYLLFPEDIKIVHAISSASDCTFLQADIEHI
jgi:hypothetical protein